MNGTELEVLRLPAMSYIITIRHNRRYAELNADDTKRIIEDLGVEGLIENLLYLNTVMFHIDPVVLPDRNYKYCLEIPLKSVGGFLYILDCIGIIEYPGAEVNFTLDDKARFYGSIVNDELLAARKGAEYETY